MATLQTIRTKAGLLISIVIGLSLAAFILGDMFQSGNSLFQKNRLEVGEIDGESIQYPDFQREVEELAEIYKMNTQQTQLDENTMAQIREQTWQNNIRDIVMEDVYKKLGIEVSSDELFDMLQGTNLHPVVQQLFRNPNTGQVDRGAVVRFLKNLESGGVDQEQRDYWLYLERQIVQDRIQSKYMNMVGKGLYVTSEEAKNSISERSKQVSFDYIQLDLSSIADSAVSVSDQEMKSYYEKNRDDYKQEKTRNIDYISFDVVPSSDDYKSAEKWINEIKNDFETTTDNIQFVSSNSDESFDDTWHKKETLPENIGTWIFDEGASENAVFGPWFENNSYKLAKVHSIKMLPDSVEARHILLQVTSQPDLIAKQALADSLKTAIESGSDFGTLARLFSTDQGSAIQGGDLGWFSRGQMVKPFEEAAFSNDKNGVSVVASQFGIHIVQTTDKSKESKQVQVAYLVRNVVSSTQTYQNIYAIASRFASDNTTQEKFNTAVTEQKLNKKTAAIGENDRDIAGLENARLLIRAAYDSEPGDVILSQEGSPIFELGDSYVIAVLTSAKEEGTMSFEEVKSRVELSLIKEKKLEYLAGKATDALNGKNNLDAVASELGTSVKSAAGINFSSFQIPGVGLEPAVIGTVTSLNPDVISKPVKGNNGVFIVKVTSVNENESEDIVEEQQRLAQTMSFRATSSAYEAYRKTIEVTDKRAKFY